AEIRCARSPTFMLPYGKTLLKSVFGKPIKPMFSGRRNAVFWRRSTKHQFHWVSRNRFGWGLFVHLHKAIFHLPRGNRGGDVSRLVVSAAPAGNLMACVIAVGQVVVFAFRNK